MKRMMNIAAAALLGAVAGCSDTPAAKPQIAPRVADSSALAIRMNPAAVKDFSEAYASAVNSASGEGSKELKTAQDALAAAGFGFNDLKWYTMSVGNLRKVETPKDMPGVTVAVASAKPVDPEGFVNTCLGLMGEDECARMKESIKAEPFAAEGVKGWKIVILDEDVELPPVSVAVVDGNVLVATIGDASIDGAIATLRTGAGTEKGTFNRIAAQAENVVWGALIPNVGAQAVALMGDNLDAMCGNFPDGTPMGPFIKGLGEFSLEVASSETALTLNARLATASDADATRIKTLFDMFFMMVKGSAAESFSGDDAQSKLAKAAIESLSLAAEGPALSLTVSVPRDIAKEALAKGYAESLSAAGILK